MEDLRYILDIPIEIEGLERVSLKALNIKDYTKYSTYFGSFQMTVNYLLQQIETKNLEERQKVIDNMKNFDIVCMDGMAILMLMKLIQVSFGVSEEEVFFDRNEIAIYVNDFKIDRDNYDKIKDEILKINNIKLPRQAKTKELQEWFEKARKVHNKGADKTDMEDILTAIMAITGYTPMQLSEMTIYQINKIIERINKVKEYETNVQFLCVGSDKIQLEHFTAHISDSTKDEAYGTDFDAFQREMGGIMTGS